MSILLNWPEALEAAGVPVRVLPNWDEVHVIGGTPYDWRESDGEAAGMMHHHTASVVYTPNDEKASGYAGLGIEGSNRLYQEDYGDNEMFPVFTIANAFPAPISSGYGVRAVLEQFVKENIPFTGRPGSDDNWAGNTHYINIEWVLDGTGSPIDQRVWDMMVTVCQVTNELMSRPGHLWTPARHVAHGHHTRRKIDLWGGQFSHTNVDGFDKTLMALREAMGVDMNCPWTNSSYPPCDSHYTPDTDMPLGNGAGQHQGQCNVPDNQHKAVDWAFETRRFIPGNRRRYDYATILTEGREMVFEYRDAT